MDSIKMGQTVVKAVEAIGKLNKNMNRITEIITIHTEQLGKIADNVLKISKNQAEIVKKLDEQEKRIVELENAAADKYM